MQSKQYFTKIKNYPHEKSTEPGIYQSGRNDQKPIAAIYIWMEYWNIRGMNFIPPSDKLKRAIIFFDCSFYLVAPGGIEPPFQE